MHRSSDLEAENRASARPRFGFAIALWLFLSPAASAADLQGIFGGQAYGIDSKTNATAVDTALDRLGLVLLGCIGTEGRTASGSVAQLSVPGVLSAGTIASTAFSDKTATSAVARDVSTITGLKALGGLIKADAIKADARVIASLGSIALDDGNSGFTNLRIAGTPVPTNVPPNTEIPVPGIGTATLKRITKVGGGAQNAGSIRVEMLVVDFASSNLLGFPADSQIIVGSAYSRFERGAFPVNISGAAYGALATGNASKALKSKIGSVALVTAGCRGTNGKTVTASSTGVDADTALSADAATSNGIAGPSGDAIAVRFVSQVQNASLLEGLVRAGSIKAVAEDKLRNGKRTSSATTTFNALRVNDQAVSNPAPNTHIDIPGFGYVILNEQTIPAPDSRDRTEVNALRVFITRSNTLGLPVGTQIVVGHAKSLVFPVPDSVPGT